MKKLSLLLLVLSIAPAMAESLLKDSTQVVAELQAQQTEYTHRNIQSYKNRIVHDLNESARYSNDLVDDLRAAVEELRPELTIKHYKIEYKGYRNYPEDQVLITPTTTVKLL